MVTNEQASIQRMIANRRMHGIFDQAKAGHPAPFYETRQIFLDCRGQLSIHPNTGWGWFAAVITTSHDTVSGETMYGENMSKVVDRPVTVDDGAYIGSFAILYNCHIKHHAVVACGAVVRNKTVEPYTVVEGNPAKPVKVFENGKWVKIEQS